MTFSLPISRRFLSLLLTLAVGGFVTVFTPSLVRAEGDAALTGIKGDMDTWIGDAEEKMTELANAIPADKYAWKPTKEVRSVAEVFMHAAAANFGLPSFIGVKPPEGFDFSTFEGSAKTKDAVMKQMAESFAHARKVVREMKDADMDNPVDLFGHKSSVRGVGMLLVAHNHEHLGQMIAYARSIGVTPPWTARQAEAAAAAAKDKKK